MRWRTPAARRLGTVRVAICTLALLANATVLPLLHAQHGGAAGLERAAALIARTTNATGTAELATGDQSRAPAHDATSCPVCATLSHGGAAIAPAVAATASLPLLASRLTTIPFSGAAAPDLTHGAPRAPPALVS